MKERNYTLMPARVSSVASEIEAKQLLQTEQIRIASRAGDLLLYYISGGNEWPKNLPTPADKVRPEDQDLRGWFSETYGDYLTHLTSDLECSKDNPTRVKEITDTFTATPYGYVLRTGAVNEYHIGRIITNAAEINRARTEAKKYSKDLAILCAKLLLSGEAPNNNIFDIMHSSIRLWYNMTGATRKLYFEEYIAKAPTTGTNKKHNHTTYLFEVVSSIFDMLSYNENPAYWITNPDVATSLDALDGATQGDETNTKNAISILQGKIHRHTLLIVDAESKGWDSTPKMTQALKTAMTTVVSAVEYHGYGDTKTESDIARAHIPVYENLQSYKDAAALAIGAEVPQGLLYNFYHHTRTNTINKSNTSTLWSNYNRYLELGTQRAGYEAGIQTKSLALTTMQESEKSLADWHRTPCKEIYGLFETNTSAGLAAKVAWVNYIYNFVKTKLGLNFTTTSFRVTPGSGSVYSPYPALVLPLNSYIPLTTKEIKMASTGAVVGHLIVDGVDISRTILLYAKALQGVTPTAYWTANLSHRIVLRERPHGEPGHEEPFTEVYMYSANMKTGGISSESALLSRVSGDKASAFTSVNSFLPDVPQYQPGTNVQLSSKLSEAFSSKVQDSPALKQWLGVSAKESFQYAYVISSAWDPVYTVVNKQQQRMSTYNPPSRLIGASGHSAPPINGHTEWLQATDYAEQQFKGVRTFAPNTSTLKFDIMGREVKESWPTYFDAKGSLTATNMYCVAVDKAVIKKITEYMEEVPAKIQRLLDRVNNKADTANYLLGEKISANLIYGNQNTMEAAWPEYRGYRDMFETSKFLKEMDVIRTFLLNRTESLFIDDIATATKKAYDRFTNNKPTFRYGRGLPYKYLGRHLHHYLTANFDTADFGNTYTDYMAILGAIAYFNSYEMLTDTPAHRTYAEWAKPFKGPIDSVVNSILGSSIPRIIYQDSINDTEDVSNLHQTLNALGAFEGMTEMPVFDIQEFHINWRGHAPDSVTKNTPFTNTGLLNIPVGGLKASAFRGLQRGYGDVFYETIMNTCVMRPRIGARPKLVNAGIGKPIMYSSLRIPVNTRGVSSKVYGMRPGSRLAFNTGSNASDVSVFSAGSGSLTYTGLAGMASVAFAGVLGIAMFKNIASETAFSDKRFKIDDKD